MPSNNEIFREFVRGHKPSLPILPAVHITRAAHINKIFDTNKLHLSPCEKFKKDLLYLFYGKPLYRLKSDSDAVSNLSLDAAVCFVLKLNKLPDAHRVFALDTGAWFDKRYNIFFSRGVSVEDFELDINSESAAKLVSAFFGGNKNYFIGETKNDICISGLDIISDAYKAIATESVSNSFDDRARTCELQYGVELELNKESLHTIILPDKLMGDERCQEKMRQWEIKPITYLFRRGIPGERTEIIFQKIGDYYEREQYI
jgi:hypothetical protein